MKKISIVLAIALLAPIAIVRAEATTTSSEDQKPVLMQLREKINKVEDKAAAKKDTIDERASTTKNKLGSEVEKLDKKNDAKKEAGKTKALVLARKTETKINAAISRIELLANRTQERLNILSNKGVVKAETKIQVETKLADAKILLTDAKIFSAQILDSADAAIASSSPKQALNATKIIAKEAEDKIKAAHAKVVEAVSMIKASVEKETTSATTTP